MVKNNIRAFSLIELSVSLVIIGMIASSALSVAITSDSYAKITETRAKLDAIDNALSGFVALNFRLPCPADGELAQTNADFGSEGTRSDSTCPQKNYEYDPGSGVAIYYGVVPVTTLQLPDDFMFDGWGRRFKYMVDRDAANNTSTNADCLTGSGNTSICLKGMTSEEININYVNGDTIDASVVVLSHGENGHGAYNKAGSSTRINGFPTGNPYRDNSIAEFANAMLDKDGAATAAAPDIYVKEALTATNYFDDIVRYKTKGQLVKDSGYLFFDADCKTAQDYINDPSGTGYCLGAADEDTCEQLATEINSRCLQ